MISAHALSGAILPYALIHLRAKMTGRVNRPAAVTAGWLEKELWFYMIVAAALLLVVEWFTYHRGITV